MKRAVAIGLLVAASAIPVDSGAVPVIVSNCSRDGSVPDPGTWQSGQWAGITLAFARAADSRFWSAGASGSCSVLAGEFDGFTQFTAWWTGPLGRSLAEILNAAELEGRDWVQYSSANPNPAALIFLQGTGLATLVGPFDPYDPAQVAGLVDILDGLAAPLTPSVSWVSGPIEVWLAPTSALPVPEPGTLALAAVALAVMVLRTRPA